MAKVKKWIESRKAEHEPEEYVKTKQEFTMAIGKPFITIKVEIPEGFENFHTEFLHLEKDTLFQAEVADLVRKRLIYETRYGKPES
ncbi:MAG: hypothetical protein NWE78_08235 [Candidatus Bathyarchaeota archaeon]|nr:hypothetical protein [Candidatus Bathyarchaeota archaeon]